MKISLTIENGNDELRIEWRGQGCSEEEAGEKLNDLVGSVEKFLTHEPKDEPRTIRHGVFF